MTRDWTQEQIDDHMFDDDDELFDMCGLGPDGQCSQAGTEHCDFCCPNRDSDLFVGSRAWREKQKRKRKGGR